jgi:hypothetical protein
MSKCARVIKQRGSRDSRKALSPMRARGTAEPLQTALKRERLCTRLKMEIPVNVMYLSVMRVVQYFGGDGHGNRAAQERRPEAYR